MSLVPRCQSLAFKNLAKTVDLTVMRQSSSVFSSVFSPAAGKYVWKMKPEDYDYVQVNYAATHSAPIVVPYLTLHGGLAKPRIGT